MLLSSMCHKAPMQSVLTALYRMITGFLCPRRRFERMYISVFYMLLILSTVFVRDVSGVSISNTASEQLLQDVSTNSRSVMNTISISAIRSSYSSMNDNQTEWISSAVTSSIRDIQSSLHSLSHSAIMKTIKSKLMTTTDQIRNTIAVTNTLYSSLSSSFAVSSAQLSSSLSSSSSPPPPSSSLAPSAAASVSFSSSLSSSSSSSKTPLSSLLRTKSASLVSSNLVPPSLPLLSSSYTTAVSATTSLSSSLSSKVKTSVTSPTSVSSVSFILSAATTPTTLSSNITRQITSTVHTSYSSKTKQSLSLINSSPLHIFTDISSGIQSTPHRTRIPSSPFSSTTSTPFTQSIGSHISTINAVGSSQISNVDRHLSLYSSIHPTPAANSQLAYSSTNSVLKHSMSDPSLTDSKLGDIMPSSMKSIESVSLRSSSLFNISSKSSMTRSTSFTNNSNASSKTQNAFMSEYMSTHLRTQNTMQNSTLYSIASSRNSHFPPSDTLSSISNASIQSQSNHETTYSSSHLSQSTPHFKQTDSALYSSMSRPSTALPTTSVSPSHASSTDLLNALSPSFSIQSSIGINSKSPTYQMAQASNVFSSFQLLTSSPFPTSEAPYISHSNVISTNLKVTQTASRSDVISTNLNVTQTASERITVSEVITSLNHSVLSSTLQDTSAQLLSSSSLGAPFSINIFDTSDNLSKATTSVMMKSSNPISPSALKHVSGLLASSLKEALSVSSFKSLATAETSILHPSYLPISIHSTGVETVPLTLSLKTTSNYKSNAISSQIIASKRTSILMTASGTYHEGTSSGPMYTNTDTTISLHLSPTLADVTLPKSMDITPGMLTGKYSTIVSLDTSWSLLNDVSLSKVLSIATSTTNTFGIALHNGKEVLSTDNTNQRLLTTLLTSVTDGLTDVALTNSKSVSQTKPDTSTILQTLTANSNSKSKIHFDKSTSMHMIPSTTRIVIYIESEASSSESSVIYSTETPLFRADAILSTSMPLDFKTMFSSSYSLTSNSDSELFYLSSTRPSLHISSSSARSFVSPTRRLPVSSHNTAVSSASSLFYTDLTLSHLPESSIVNTGVMRSTSKWNGNMSTSFKSNAMKSSRSSAKSIKPTSVFTLSSTINASISLLTPTQSLTSQSFMQGKHPSSMHTSMYKQLHDSDTGLATYTMKSSYSVGSQINPTVAYTCSLNSEYVVDILSTQSESLTSTAYTATNSWSFPIQYSVIPTGMDQYTSNIKPSSQVETKLTATRAKSVLTLSSNVKFSQYMSQLSLSTDLRRSHYSMVKSTTSNSLVYFSDSLTTISHTPSVSPTTTYTMLTSVNYPIRSTTSLNLNPTPTNQYSIKFISTLSVGRSGLDISKQIYGSNVILSSLNIVTQSSLNAKSFSDSASRLSASTGMPSGVSSEYLYNNTTKMSSNSVVSYPNILTLSSSRIYDHESSHIISSSQNLTPPSSSVETFASTIADRIYKNTIAATSVSLNSATFATLSDPKSSSQLILPVKSLGSTMFSMTNIHASKTMLEQQTPILRTTSNMLYSSGTVFDMPSAVTITDELSTESITFDNRQGSVSFISNSVFKSIPSLTSQLDPSSSKVLMRSNVQKSISKRSESENTVTTSTTSSMMGNSVPAATDSSYTPSTTILKPTTVTTVFRMPESNIAISSRWSIQLKSKYIPSLNSNTILDMSSTPSHLNTQTTPVSPTSIKSNTANHLTNVQTSFTSAAFISHDYVLPLQSYSLLSSSISDVSSSERFTHSSSWNTLGVHTSSEINTSPIRSSSVQTIVSDSIYSQHTSHSSISSDKQILSHSTLTTTGQIESFSKSVSSLQVLPVSSHPYSISQTISIRTPSLPTTKTYIMLESENTVVNSIPSFYENRSQTGQYLINSLSVETHELDALRTMISSQETSLSPIIVTHTSLDSRTYSESASLLASNNLNTVSSWSSRAPTKYTDSKTTHSNSDVRPSSGVSISSGYGSKSSHWIYSSQTLTISDSTLGKATPTSANSFYNNSFVSTTAQLNSISSAIAVDLSASFSVRSLEGSMLGVTNTRTSTAELEQLTHVLKATSIVSPSFGTVSNIPSTTAQINTRFTDNWSISESVASGNLPGSILPHSNNLFKSAVSFDSEIGLHSTNTPEIPTSKRAESNIASTTLFSSFTKVRGVSIAAITNSMVSTATLRSFTMVAMTEKSQSAITKALDWSTQPMSASILSTKLYGKLDSSLSPNWYIQPTPVSSFPPTPDDSANRLPTSSKSFTGTDNMLHDSVFSISSNVLSSHRPLSTDLQNSSQRTTEALLQMSNLSSKVSRTQQLTIDVSSNADLNTFTVQTRNLSPTQSYPIYESENTAFGSTSFLHVNPPPTSLYRMSSISRVLVETPELDSSGRIDSAETNLYSYSNRTYLPLNAKTYTESGALPLSTIIDTDARSSAGTSSGYMNNVSTLMHPDSNILSTNSITSALFIRRSTHSQQSTLLSQDPTPSNTITGGGTSTSDSSFYISPTFIRLTYPSSVWSASQIIMSSEISSSRIRSNVLSYGSSPFSFRNIQTLDTIPKEHTTVLKTHASLLYSSGTAFRMVSTTSMINSHFTDKLSSTDIVSSNNPQSIISSQLGSLLQSVINAVTELGPSAFFTTIQSSAEVSSSRITEPITAINTLSTSFTEEITSVSRISELGSIAPLTTLSSSTGKTLKFVPRRSASHITTPSTWSAQPIPASLSVKPNGNLNSSQLSNWSIKSTSVSSFSTIASLRATIISASVNSLTRRDSILSISFNVLPSTGSVLVLSSFSDVHTPGQLFTSFNDYMSETDLLLQTIAVQTLISSSIPPQHISPLIGSTDLRTTTQSTVKSTGHSLSLSISSFHQASIDSQSYPVSQNRIYQTSNLSTIDTYSMLGSDKRTFNSAASLYKQSTSTSMFQIKSIATLSESAKTLYTSRRIHSSEKIFSTYNTMTHGSVRTETYAETESQQILPTNLGTESISSSGLPSDSVHIASTPMHSRSYLTSRSIIPSPVFTEHSSTLSHLPYSSLKPLFSDLSISKYTQVLYGSFYNSLTSFKSFDQISLLSATPVTLSESFSSSHIVSTLETSEHAALSHLNAPSWTEVPGHSTLLLQSTLRLLHSSRNAFDKLSTATLIDKSFTDNWSSVIHLNSISSLSDTSFKSVFSRVSEFPSRSSSTTSRYFSSIIPSIRSESEIKSSSPSALFTEDNSIAFDTKFGSITSTSSRSSGRLNSLSLLSASSSAIQSNKSIQPMPVSAFSTHTPERSNSLTSSEKLLPSASFILPNSVLSIPSNSPSIMSISLSLLSNVQTSKQLVMSQGMHNRASDMESSSHAESSLTSDKVTPMQALSDSSIISQHVSHLSSSIDLQLALSQSAVKTTEQIQFLSTDSSSLQYTSNIIKTFSNALTFDWQHPSLSPSEPYIAFTSESSLSTKTLSLHLNATSTSHVPIKSISTLPLETPDLVTFGLMESTENTLSLSIPFNRMSLEASTSSESISLIHPSSTYNVKRSLEGISGEYVYDTILTLPVTGMTSLPSFSGLSSSQLLYSSEDLTFSVSRNIKHVTSYHSFRKGFISSKSVNRSSVLSATAVNLSASRTSSYIVSTLSSLGNTVLSDLNTLVSTPISEQQTFVQKLTSSRLHSPGSTYELSPTETITYTGLTDTISFSEKVASDKRVSSILSMTDNSHKNTFPLFPTFGSSGLTTTMSSAEQITPIKPESETAIITSSTLFTEMVTYSGSIVSPAALPERTQSDTATLSNMYTKAITVPPFSIKITDRLNTLTTSATSFTSTLSTQRDSVHALSSTSLYSINPISIQSFSDAHTSKQLVRPTSLSAITELSSVTSITSTMVASVLALGTSARRSQHSTHLPLSTYLKHTTKHSVKPTGQTKNLSTTVSSLQHSSINSYPHSYLQTTLSQTPIASTSELYMVFTSENTAPSFTPSLYMSHTSIMKNTTSHSAKPTGQTQTHPKTISSLQHSSINSSPPYSDLQTAISQTPSVSTSKSYMVFTSEITASSITPSSYISPTSTIHYHIQSISTIGFETKKLDTSLRMDTTVDILSSFDYITKLSLIPSPSVDTVAISVSYESSKYLQHASKTTGSNSGVLSTSLIPLSVSSGYDFFDSSRLIYSSPHLPLSDSRLINDRSSSVRSFYNSESSSKSANRSNVLFSTPFTFYELYSSSSSQNVLPSINSLQSTALSDLTTLASAPTLEQQTSVLKTATSVVHSSVTAFEIHSTATSTGKHLANTLSVSDSLAKVYSQSSNSMSDSFLKNTVSIVSEFGSSASTVRKWSSVGKTTSEQLASENAMFTSSIAFIEVSSVSPTTESGSTGSIATRWYSAMKPLSERTKSEIIITTSFTVFTEAASVSPVPNINSISSVITVSSSAVKTVSGRPKSDISINTLSPSFTAVNRGSVYTDFGSITSTATLRLSIEKSIFRTSESGSAVPSASTVLPTATSYTTGTVISSSITTSVSKSSSAVPSSSTILTAAISSTAGTVISSSITTPESESGSAVPSSFTVLPAATSSSTSAVISSSMTTSILESSAAVPSPTTVLAATTSSTVGAVTSALISTSISESGSAVPSSSTVFHTAISSTTSAVISSPITTSVSESGSAVPSSSTVFQTAISSTAGTVISSSITTPESESGSGVPSSYTVLQADISSTVGAVIFSSITKIISESGFVVPSSFTATSSTTSAVISSSMTTSVLESSSAVPSSYTVLAATTSSTVDAVTSSSISTSISESGSEVQSSSTVLSATISSIAGVGISSSKTTPVFESDSALSSASIILPTVISSSVGAVISSSIPTPVSESGYVVPSTPTVPPVAISSTASVVISSPLMTFVSELGSVISSSSTILPATISPTASAVVSSSITTPVSESSSAVPSSSSIFPADISSTVGAVISSPITTFVSESATAAPRSSTLLSATISSTASVVPSSSITTSVSPTSSPRPGVSKADILTIGIQVKPSERTEDETFINSLKSGLLQCYNEGRSKATGRRRRDTQPVKYDVTVTGVNRTSETSTNVNVEFYLTADNVPIPAKQVEPVFTQLSPVEMSAILKYPVTAPVQARLASPPPEDQTTAFSTTILYIIIGIPTGCVVAATIVLGLLYCPCRRPTDHHAAAKYWKQFSASTMRKPTLEDLDLMVDVERGEVINKDCAFDNVLPLQRRTSMLQDKEQAFHRPTDLDSEFIEGTPLRNDDETTFRKTFSEICSPSVRANRLRALGFMVSAIKSPQTKVNTATQTKNEVDSQTQTDIPSIYDSVSENQTVKLKNVANQLIANRRFKTNEDTEGRGFDSYSSNILMSPPSSKIERYKGEKRLKLLKNYNYDTMSGTSVSSLNEEDRDSLSSLNEEDRDSLNVADTNAETDALSASLADTFDSDDDIAAKIESLVYRSSSDSEDTSFEENILFDRARSLKKQIEKEGYKAKQRQGFRKDGHPLKRYPTNDNIQEPKQFKKKTHLNDAKNKSSFISKDNSKVSMSTRSKTKRARVPIDGYCQNIFQKPGFTSLTLGKVPREVNNFIEGDLEDEVFTPDQSDIDWSDTLDEHRETQRSERQNVANRDRQGNRQPIRAGNGYHQSNRISNTPRSRRDNPRHYPQNTDVIREQYPDDDSELLVDQEHAAHNDINDGGVVNPVFNRYMNYYNERLNISDPDIDGSEYAGNEFECVNFTPQPSRRDNRRQPHTEHTNMANANMMMVAPGERPYVCEHVAKMGRVGHRSSLPQSEARPQFRDLPFQMEFSAPPNTVPVAVVTTEKPPPVPTPTPTQVRHTQRAPYEEMKLGRNMRAVPRGGVPVRSSRDQLDSDASVPLLHGSQPSNIVVEYYTNTRAPRGHTQGGPLVTRAVTSPQHPSQELIETLNRNLSGNPSTVVYDVGADEKLSLFQKQQEELLRLRQEAERRQEEENRQRKHALEEERQRLLKENEQDANRRHREDIKTRDELLQSSFPLSNTSANADAGTKSPSPPASSLLYQLAPDVRKHNAAELMSSQPFSPVPPVSFDYEGGKISSGYTHPANKDAVRTQEPAVQEDDSIGEEIEGGEDKKSDDSDFF